MLNFSWYCVLRHFLTEKSVILYKNGVVAPFATTPMMFHLFKIFSTVFELRAGKGIIGMGDARLPMRFSYHVTSYHLPSLYPADLKCPTHSKPSFLWKATLGSFGWVMQAYTVLKFCAFKSSKRARYNLLPTPARRSSLSIYIDASTVQLYAHRSRR